MQRLGSRWRRAALSTAVFVVSATVALAPASNAATHSRASSASKYTVIKIWVVPTYFTTPPTAGDRAALARAAADSKAYYFDESLGKYRFWIQPLRSNLKVARGKNCNVAAAENAARTSLRKLLGPSDVVVTWTQRITCDYAGVGGGNSVWVQTTDSGVLVHELGHAIFGFRHDGRIDCQQGNTYVTVSSTCTYDEYGNFYSVMGAGGVEAGLTASELLASGMRSSSQAMLATASGHYTVHRRASVSGTILLVVPWRGDLKYGLERLDLEYRSAVGRDKWLSDVNGVFGLRGGTGILVSTENPNKWTDGKATGFFGFAGCTCGLLNMHPSPRNDPDDGSYTPSLQAGESWSSPDGAVSITVTSLTSDVAQLDVVRAKDVQQPFPFSISFYVDHQKGKIGMTSIQWDTPRAYWNYMSGDDWGVKSYVVRIDSQPKRTITRGPHTLGDAESSLTVKLAKGAHRIIVTAVDDAGNARTVARSITVK